MRFYILWRDRKAADWNVLINGEKLEPFRSEHAADLIVLYQMGMDRRNRRTRIYKIVQEAGQQETTIKEEEQCPSLNSIPTV